MNYLRKFISNKERREWKELLAWWKDRKENSPNTPVQWQPKGKLRKLNRKRTKPPTIDSGLEQGYTEGHTSLSSESPLPLPGQGVLALKDKDGK